jgi:hypothetical protein
MKKRKQKQTQVVMHQHNDEAGRIFGSKHPIHLEHNNERTQRHHDYTIGVRNRMNKNK